jgi:hypothetical protein
MPSAPLLYLIDILWEWGLLRRQNQQRPAILGWTRTILDIFDADSDQICARLPN